MTLRITRRAERHLDEIADYISERNPDAARRVGRRIREIFELLAALPLVGREVSWPGRARWWYPVCHMLSYTGWMMESP